jgi:hypothetical protein
MCKQPQMTFAQGLGDLSYKTPRLCQFCHALQRTLLLSSNLKLSFCNSQCSPIQSTPIAYCRKVMAANSFDWCGYGGFGCCANSS